MGEIHPIVTHLIVKASNNQKYANKYAEKMSIPSF